MFGIEGQALGARRPACPQTRAAAQSALPGEEALEGTVPMTVGPSQVPQPSSQCLCPCLGDGVTSPQWVLPYSSGDSACAVLGTVAIGALVTVTGIFLHVHVHVCASAWCGEWVFACVYMHICDHVCLLTCAHRCACSWRGCSGC